MNFFHELHIIRQGCEHMLKLKCFMLFQVLLHEKHAFYKSQKAKFQALINQNFDNMKAQTLG